MVVVAAVVEAKAAAAAAAAVAALVVVVVSLVVVIEWPRRHFAQASILQFRRELEEERGAKWMDTCIGIDIHKYLDLHGFMVTAEADTVAANNRPTRIFRDTPDKCRLVADSS